MATIQTISTAHELLDARHLGRCELIRGELVMMSPAGCDHGRIAVNIATEVKVYASANGLGIVLGAETGFWITRNPDTVRAPDVAFVHTDRVPAGPMPGFFPGAPDLAVEVLSPNDQKSEVLAKVQAWLDAGCRAVWIADPATRTVSIHRLNTAVIRLTEADVLKAEDLLPGFRLPVAEVFR